ncbi:MULTISPECIES: hypothetical protein [Sphingomonas]|jgi:hypothetical protein|uniref:hypothetical protein n=1 Tax=Sphingomonas TaxID=13687 RepID=UPI001AEDCF8A|nr:MULTISPECIES: hypothetical protein [Sphingomonas]
MKDCDDIVEGLLDEAKAHVALAVSASATSVAEMHIELATFHVEQMLSTEVLCPDLDETTAAVMQRVQRHQ